MSGRWRCVVFFGRLDADLRRREAALADLLDFERDRQAERGEAGADRVGVDAGVDEGAERHVAADAAETVEMSHTQFKISFS